MYDPFDPYNYNDVEPTYRKSNAYRSLDYIVERAVESEEGDE